MRALGLVLVALLFFAVLGRRLISGLSGLSGASSIFGTGAVTESLNNSNVAFWKMNEATGANRTDSVSTNTLTNNATVVQALGADGVTLNASGFVAALTQYLSIADNPALSMGTGVRMTLTFWFFQTTATVSKALVSKFNTTTNNREYNIITGSQSGHPTVNFAVSSNGTSATQVQSAAYGDATWYFVTCYYDGVNIGISLNNGAFITAAFSADIFDGASEFDIGRRSTGDSYCDGTIQAVGLWKRVLTAAEITRLYNGGLPLVPTAGVWATAA